MSENGNGNGFDSLYEFTTLEARELDLGGLVGKLSGAKVKVYVNKPGLREALAEREAREVRTDFDRDGNITHTEVVYPNSADSYDKYRRAVALMYDQPLEKVKTLDDDKLLWLFNEGYKLVTAYTEELKNSNGASTTLTN